MTRYMARFLSNDELWHEIEVRLHASRNTKAAIACYGSNGAKLIRPKRGDILVVGMILAGVRQGTTNPHEIRKLIKRGVTVFTYAAVAGPFIAAIDRAGPEGPTDGLEVLNELTSLGLR